ncbi:MAG: hypothetical protein IEMM0006_0792 [bacterium]|nr:MAG: hypothetical protein IEMM0006_0792 [bacterium]
MKKQILTVVALVVFSFTGIAFAEGGMSFPVNMSGESALTMEISVMQPDSSGKQKQSMMDKKAKMHGKTMQMQNMQGMKMMPKKDSTQRSMMMQMRTMMMRMMHMMKKGDTISGKGMKMGQKGQMHDKMQGMKTMSKDSTQRAMMIQMRTMKHMMICMMKHGDMANGKGMKMGQKGQMQNMSGMKTMKMHQGKSVDNQHKSTKQEKKANKKARDHHREKK